ncbi:hypothetical protein D3C85_1874590 [compost metagenome]
MQIDLPVMQRTEYVVVADDSLRKLTRLMRAAVLNRLDRTSRQLKHRDLDRPNLNYP